MNTTGTTLELALERTQGDAKETLQTVPRGMSSLALLLVLVVLTCTVACIPPKSQLVGKWQEINGTELLEFYEDRTYNLSSGGFIPLSYGGTYSFPDNQHLRLTPKAFFFGLEETYSFRLAGGRLIVTPLGGKTVEYRKVP